MKKLFLWLHRWFGLIVGFYFVLLGLTGSYLVFDDYFESLLKSRFYKSDTSSVHVDLAALIESAQKGIGTDRLPQTLRIPEGSNENTVLTFNMSEGRERRNVKAFVDLAESKFLGSEVFSESSAGMIFRFHHDLFFGQIGKTIAAISGILMLAILLTGLYLWWPKKGGWKKAFTWKQLKNFFLVNFELHRLAGIYTLVLMLLVTFTGVVIARPDWFGGAGRGRPPGMDGGSGDAVEFNFAKISAALSEQDLLHRGVTVSLDQRKGIVKLEDLRDGQKKTMQLDVASLEMQEGKGEQRKPSFRNQNFVLHSGLFWGQVGKVLIFLSGILPLLFYISGFYIWIKKSPKKK